MVSESAAATIDGVDAVTMEPAGSEGGSAGAGARCSEAGRFLALFLSWIVRLGKVSPRKRVGGWVEVRPKRDRDETARDRGDGDTAPEICRADKGYS